jgi:hypothetical protein
MGRVVVVLLIGAALAAPAIAGDASARWTHQRAESDVLTRTWPDHRIVVGASCVGLDGSVASRFSCYSNIYSRPTHVPLARWDAIGAAMRSRDTARLFVLLGLPASPTETQVNAAAARSGLARSRPVAVGLRVASARRATVGRAAIPVRAFAASVHARRALLEAVPAIEAYQAKNGTYAGVTATRLQAIDSSVSAEVRIVAASRGDYCAEIGSGYTAWFARGPGATPAFGRC